MTESSQKVMHRILASLLGMGIVAAIFLGIYLTACEKEWCIVFEWQKAKAIESFEQCEKMGFPVRESYPRQCEVAGKLFVEDIVEVEDVVGSDPILGDAAANDIEVKEPEAGIRGVAYYSGRPFKGSVDISNVEGQFIKSVTSDSDGKFEAGLAPGSYIVSLREESSSINSGTEVVLVEKDKFSFVEITASRL